MKILLVNKFYYPRGGDCTYTIALESLLKKEGHKVAIFAMQYPDNIQTSWSKYFPSEIDFSFKNIVKSIVRPLGSKEVKKNFNKLIDNFTPDIIHLNNIHTQLSPILAEIAHKKRIKVVWTLHDYKLLCPRYDCLKNGISICEDCFENKKYVVKNNCMKNSFFASLLAYNEAKKWSKDKLGKYTDAFICPSAFMSKKMQQGGFSATKLHVKHNFINIQNIKDSELEKENYYCYVGRLSHEKGIETLLKASAKIPYKLVIIGDGILKEKLKNETNNVNATFAGYKNWDEIKKIVGKAKFIVIPSEWYENNPFSVIESLCLGTPVLGANIGGIPELIEEGKNGTLFEPRNIEDLKDKIEIMFSTEFDYKEIAEEAQECFSAESYYDKLMEIYNA